MILRVTQYGEPVLREKGRPITSFDQGLAKLARDMVETMYAAGGIGLAAQQVNHALLLCVIDVQSSGDPPDFSYALDGKRPPLRLCMPLVLVNPVLETEPEPLDTMEEGCLSFPGVRGEIERPDRVTVTFQDLQGHSHVLQADGLLARVVQHEYDHLQGVLFIDRMAPETVRAVEEPLRLLKKEIRASLAAARIKPVFHPTT